MKLSKFDIGAEIIAILTKGMYQDPRDALREYIQNAVDAHSKNIDLKIRQNNITIIDDGIGMDYQTMRKALRVGISDKKPGEDVGFMGIGIYSSYHLCNTLTIYSKTDQGKPYKLFMDFAAMKSVLAHQKELRINNKLSGDDLLDLQTLLENFIDLTDEKGLSLEEYSRTGTRIELHGIEENFYKELLNFDIVASYLKDVVPLHFNKEKFIWGDKIESKIQEICKQHNVKFDLVNLKLQVNNRIENLYKSYKDTDFHENNPNEPDFQEIKSGNTFIGVAWGCQNPTRNKIRDKDLRGFLIRKQGFAIGRRESVVKFFNSHTYFDRYIGEIIVVHSGLLPNASRDDFEFSNLRIQFQKVLAKVGSHYNDVSKKFQDTSKAIENLQDIAKKVKIKNAEFTRYEEDSSKLIDLIVELRTHLNTVNSILKRKVLKDDKDEEDNAKLIKDNINILITDLQNRIEFISKEKKKNSKKKETTKKDHQNEISKNLSSVDAKESKQYDNLVELLTDLDFELTESYKQLFNIIDEKFIERAATNKTHYYNLITELKGDIQDLMDEQ